MEKKPEKSILIPILLLLSAIAAAVLLFVSSEGENEYPLVLAEGEPGRFISRFETMGTDAAVVVYADGYEQARSFIEPAVEAIEEINRLMSFYRPGSELSELNRAGADNVMRVSDHTFKVIEKSIEFAGLTGGAFDITYTPLRDIWQEAQKENALPAQETLDSVIEKTTGAHHIELLEENGIRLLAEGMLLDLGGIAKGYGVDMAVSELIRAGCNSALVDIGGDMAVVGRKKDGQKWRIQVRDPGEETSPEPVVLEVEGLAIATSGDYARYFTVEGRRFSHIIDPRTGWPVKRIPSATVIAPDALTADALATAVSVMGAKDALELIESLAGVECMIVERKSDEEEISVHFSSGFDSFVASGKD